MVEEANGLELHFVMDMPIMMIICRMTCIVNGNMIVLVR